MPSVDVAEGPGGARYMGILLEVEHFLNTEEHSMWQLVEYCGDGPEGSYLDPKIDISGNFMYIIPDLQWKIYRGCHSTSPVVSENVLDRSNGGGSYLFYHPR